MIITSVNNDLIKELTKLNKKKFRDETNTFLVEGMHLVEEANKAGLLKRVIKTENVKFDFENTITCTDNVIAKITNTKSPQNIVGVVNKPSKTNDMKRVVVLDNVQDPGNVGTIIRTALAFDYDTIIIANGGCDVYSPKVLRATQGAIFSLNITSGTITETLKDFDGQIIGTILDDNAKELNTFEKQSKVAVILGNEGKGISQEAQDIMNTGCYIKINNAESLNVAIAAGIILNKI